MMALVKLPLNQARQEVLDIVPKMIILMRVPKFSVVLTITRTASLQTS